MAVYDVMRETTGALIFISKGPAACNQMKKRSWQALKHSLFGHCQSDKNNFKLKKTNGSLFDFVCVHVSTLHNVKEDKMIPKCSYCCFPKDAHRFF